MFEEVVGSEIAKLAMIIIASSGRTADVHTCCTSASRDQGTLATTCGRDSSSPVRLHTLSRVARFVIADTLHFRWT